MTNKNLAIMEDFIRQYTVARASYILSSEQFELLRENLDCISDDIAIEVFFEYILKRRL